VAWHIEGRYVESWSCNVVCPCVISMANGADLDYCRIVLGFNIQAGDSLKIGDDVDIEVEDIVPVGVESGEPAQVTGVFHPAGDTLTVSKANRATVNPFGIQYECKSAFSSPRFSWEA
jgi:hypothetical protein